MRYLLARSGGGGGGGGCAAAPPLAEGDAADALLHANVALESFGNAMTVRNDNSSRFGKYVRLQYASDAGPVGDPAAAAGAAAAASAWTICGARTEHFLLERSRIVSVDRGERNYHAFYQVRKSDPPERARASGASSPTARTHARASAPRTTQSRRFRQRSPLSPADCPRTPRNAPREPCRRCGVGGPLYSPPPHRTTRPSPGF